MRQKNKMLLLTAAVLFIGLVSGCSRQRQEPETGGVTDLTVNYMQNPIGVEQNLLFGWRMQDVGENQQQTAYRIVVAASEEQLAAQEYVWDSGRMASGISVAVPYQGSRLEAGTRYVWRVFVWDQDGVLAKSTDTASFEMGLTDNDWSGASWIGIRNQQSASGDATAAEACYIDRKSVV